jgi:xylan 1,4-beta-xylosidase
MPSAPGISAGLAVFQSEQHWYFIGARRTQDGAEIFLERQSGAEPQTIAKVPFPSKTAEGSLSFRVTADGPSYSFFYDATGEGWRPLREKEDGAMLSTAVAGGFVGVVLGPYARVDR